MGGSGNDATPFSSGAAIASRGSPNSKFLVRILNSVKLDRVTFDLTLESKRGRAMPKKKSGARKKAEKQKQRQKDIKASADCKSIVQRPCNSQMVGSTSGCLTIDTA